MSLLGELSFLLGLQISQLKDGIFISHTKYIKEMLKRFNMEECKPMCNPIINACKLRKYDEVNQVDQKLYGSMIGSVLCVTASRPDIMQFIRLVEIFQADPKETHVQAVKRIFRSLKRNLHCGLWYLFVPEIISKAKETSQHNLK